ncbi:protein LBH-like [Cololabis saira]|uniref:protein LBH-like n=1 Tax=Cololabis saira TaxID=129043 RepID=UPI002AD3759C|nr:protein LBH-like [Cololabis saira]
MSCIPASHSMNMLSQVEPQMEDGPVQRRGSRAYQIFPETNSSEESDYPEDFQYRRERLPSIVVEPTEFSEQDGGLARPSRCQASADEDGPTETSVEEQEEETDKSSVIRKFSISPSQSPVSTFHLTPPASPTAAEEAPPCLRN